MLRAVNVTRAFQILFQERKRSREISPLKTNRAPVKTIRESALNPFSGGEEVAKSALSGRRSFGNRISDYKIAIRPTDGVPCESLI